MDRKVFKFGFRKDKDLRYKCPNCKTDILKIDKDLFKFRETKSSIKSHDNEDFDPDWITYYYSCIFICSNCSEIVSSTGYGHVAFDGYIDEDREPQQNYYEYFIPKYFYPPLNIIDIPPKTPDSIKSELIQSFELIFCNPSSSLNHIRISLEELLTELKIKKYSKGKGRRSIINLHNRIQLLKSPYDKYIEYLLAIKWLGNAGSHSGVDVTIDDVFDAYEIIEHILTDIYVNPNLKIKNLAKEINKNKGPKKMD